MMSAVIETEERMREGETKREREREKKGAVEEGSVESRKVSTTYCRPPIFVGLEFCFTPDHENGYNEWRLVSALSC